VTGTWNERKTEIAMADRIEHAAEEAAGKVREATGTATDNQSPEARRQRRPGVRERQAGRRQGRRQAGDAGKDVFGS
jgi:uncharacterized protein YjbJ (UPF0337 family)